MGEINRWNEPQEGQYMNTRISMGAQPGQDGHCGNFNGNPGDDARTQVRARVGRTGVPQGELIFPGAKTPINPTARPDLNDCPEGELNAAMAKCKAAEHTTFPSHACLIDTCLGHMAPKPACESTADCQQAPICAASHVETCALLSFTISWNCCSH